MANKAAGSAISEDAVLGGRVRLRQPLRGHRVGHDAILLAAASGGRAGEHAVEFGSGVGAAGLALAARVPGLTVTLLEIDPALCDLAAQNATLNGLRDRVDVRCLDVTDSNAVSRLPAAERVLMNPPFNDPALAQMSPHSGKRLAHAGGAALLAAWVGAAAQVLKPQGVLTLIWRAEAAADVREAFAGRFGDVVTLPVYPRDGAAPIRVLVRGVKGAPPRESELPGLVLNDAAGKPTAAAEEILRAGRTLPIAEFTGSG
ncbi:MAG: methyltransferase [Pseudolabrys sp.]|nr:methyltransferase [Pseudolabrys sp.]MBV9954194.1 methyltransferase [Pseudolabrys sp.]